MKTILILENDFRVLRIIFGILSRHHTDVAPIVLSTSEQVEKLVNPSDLKFHLILMDRNCSQGKSFHILDIEKFDPHKVIGISSVARYNQDLLDRGVTKVITKDYDNLDQFAHDLEIAIEEFLS